MEAPRGRLRGIADEYGTIWSGVPGATGSKIIGDLVYQEGEETAEVYLEDPSPGHEPGCTLENRCCADEEGP